MTVETQQGDANTLAASHYHRGLHWWLVVTSLLALFTLFAGAEVTSRGAGLAVPDWPTSFGQWMPPMVGGVFYEHGHRMVATAVGFMTLVAAIWGGFVERRRWARRLMIAALAIVVLQGVLGGMTVLYQLPEWLSISHTTVGQTFFCLMVALAIATSRLFLDSKDNREPRANLARLRRYVFVALAAVYAQMLLGAAMRHHGAGLSIPTFPLAYGQVVPDMSDEAIEGYRWDLFDIFDAAEGIEIRNEEEALDLSSFKIGIHLAHRAGAIVLAVVLLGFAALCLRDAAREPLISGLAVTLAALLLVQIVLGILVVLSLKRPELASLHLLGGALMLATTFSLAIWLYRLPTLPSPSVGAAESH